MKINFKIKFRFFYFILFSQKEKENPKSNGFIRVGQIEFHEFDFNIS